MSIFRKLFIVALFLAFISLTYILVYAIFKTLVLLGKLMRFTLKLVLKTIKYLFISLFITVKLSFIILKGTLKIIFWAPRVTFRGLTFKRARRAHA